MAALVISLLFITSEILSYIPSIRANGVFQLTFGLLGKISKKLGPIQGGATNGDTVAVGQVQAKLDSAGDSGIAATKSSDG